SGSSDNYNITFVNGKLRVGKAGLNVTADNKTKFVGTANPVFTVNYNGFVNGETESELSILPTATSTATISSPLGTYPIPASGALAENYEISYQNGTLTVKPGAPSSVSFVTATVYENQSVGTVAGTLSSTSDDP